MKWILFKDKLPKGDQIILVNKILPMGGYYEGIYLASYIKYQDEYVLVIHDSCQNKNNYRPIKEFSHWMKLPPSPMPMVITFDSPLKPQYSSVDILSATD